jgi:hypothetical protein
VDSDLASNKNGISERFVPEQDQGQLIEAEHVSRYQWAGQAASGCLVPTELDAELTARLDHVRLVRRRDAIVYALLSDASSQQGNSTVLGGLTVRKLAADLPGDEVYTIAMASDAALPEMAELTAMTGSLELREWMSVFAAQTRAIADKDNYIDELTARLDERDRLTKLLSDAESGLAEVSDLTVRIADLEFELEAARNAAAAARQEADQLDRVLIYGRRMLRFVKALIGPVRELSRKLPG